MAVGSSRGFRRDSPRANRRPFGTAVRIVGKDESLNTYTSFEFQADVLLATTKFEEARTSSSTSTTSPALMSDVLPGCACEDPGRLDAA